MDKVTYHEIDFLLPSQRFNINFSYITQKGLPFVREFVLRLIHLAPMSKLQIANFFGFSRNEVEEAIADLVERDELILNDTFRLALTEKSNGYFTEIGEVPRLSLLRDSMTCLSFDLATFTCLGKEASSEKWKAGIQITIKEEHASRSEALVEKEFQRQFNEIFHKSYLSKSLVQDSKDAPIIYTVNSVKKIKQMPLRLTALFEMDLEGRNIERDDFEILRNSDYTHERIAVEINSLSRPSNFMDIARAMLEIGDSDTLKIFDSKKNSLVPKFIDDLNRLGEHHQNNKITFIGPIYSVVNWGILERYLAPILLSRIQGKQDVGHLPFIWLAPSDPYWGKSKRFLESISSFLDRANTKDKSLYQPKLYLPVASSEDQRSAKQWKHALEPYTENMHGLIEGFLSGAVEILYLEDELVAVVYHISIPEIYPVTLPCGFISVDKKVVSSIGKILISYIHGSSGFDRPNDCGLITQIVRN